jgi:hypothetical protein
LRAVNIDNGFASVSTISSQYDIAGIQLFPGGMCVGISQHSACLFDGRTAHGNGAVDFDDMTGRARQLDGGLALRLTRVHQLIVWGGAMKTVRKQPA